MAQTGTMIQEPPNSEHLEAIVSGRLRQALLLTVAILVVELAGALWSHSLALFSDAGHVTTDIFALGLAWFAVKQTERPADEVRSYGYHRAGILAAMANGATLIVLVFVIAWEAAQRFVHPKPVQGSSGRGHPQPSGSEQYPPELVEKSVACRPKLAPRG